MRQLGGVRVWFALTSVGAMGCEGPPHLTATGTELAVGADADIVVEEPSGGTRLVTISLSHLAPPTRVDPNATRYAAWFVPPGLPPIFAATVEYDEDARAGSARATSPYEQFEVVIAAEQEGYTAAPSELVVIRRQVP